MIICENRNAYAFDVSFIKPKGSLVDFIGESTKWTTTTLKTLREIQNCINSSSFVKTFDDVIGNKYEEYKPVTIVVTKNPGDKAPKFYMFDSTEVHAILDHLEMTHSSSESTLHRSTDYSNIVMHISRREGGVTSCNNQSQKIEFTK